MLRSSQLTGFGVRSLTAATVGGELLAGETNAMGIDFTYHADTAKQLYISDLTTPANNYNGTAEGKLTYTSPSPKLTRRANGVWTLTNGTTELPYSWDAAGVSQGILIEEQRTNLALQSDDFTNASWTKSNMTTAKTATGADGVANSATTLTATAGNATALQAITSGSALRISSVLIKRRTGTGNIDITQDNGSVWTTIAVTSSWQPLSSTNQTLTNPTVGIRIVTSGDEVDVMRFQHELGAFATSPIHTIAATVTRAKDQITLATSAFPYHNTNGTIIFAGSFGFAPELSTNKLLYTLGNTTAGQRVTAFTKDLDNTIQSYIVNATASQDELMETVGDISANTNFKFGYAFATSDMAAVINGGTVATSSDTQAVPTAATVLQFGEHYDASLQLNGYLRQLTYLKRRATNGELQTRTT